MGKRTAVEKIKKPTERGPPWSVPPTMVKPCGPLTQSLPFASLAASSRIFVNRGISYDLSILGHFRPP